jgi:hypothetical protein
MVNTLHFTSASGIKNRKYFVTFGTVSINHPPNGTLWNLTSHFLSRVVCASIKQLTSSYTPSGARGKKLSSSLRFYITALRREVLTFGVVPFGCAIFSVLSTM